MLPTPSTSHVNYDRIYEPAEDTFLVIDTLASPAETAYLRARFVGPSTAPLILEVGTGSGVVLAFATANAEHLFGRVDVGTLGIDINSYASVDTAETVRRELQARRSSHGNHATLVDTLVGDLTAMIKPECVDVLIFNPPYVPSADVPMAPTDDSERTLDTHAAFERDSRLLYLSTDGGLDGMGVTERLIAQLPDVLSPRGVAYLILCAQNRPDQVMARVRDSGGGSVWDVEKVGSSGKKAGWERLCLIRIARSSA